MRTGLAIPATLSSIKPLSLNRVDTVRNNSTKLPGQFPDTYYDKGRDSEARHYP